MAFLKYIFIFSIVFLLSCNGSSNDTSIKTTKVNGKTKSVSMKKSCLEEYVLEPCKLIDLNKISELAGVEESKFEVIPADEKLSNPKFKVCKFTWKDGRKTSFDAGGRTMELPVSNDILVGSFTILDSPKSRIKPPYTAWFDKAHRALTEEESKAFSKSMENEIDKKAESKEQAELSKGILGGVMKIGSKDEYIDIDGMADRATARVSGTTPDVYLNILHGNISFQILVNISNDKKVNLDLSKKIGEEILLLCD